VSIGYRVLSLVICALLAACGTTRPAEPPPAPSIPQKTDLSIFDPGPDETPLPPQNKAVGEKWPSELRHFIDGLLQLFGGYQRATLTNEEIEKTLGVKLTKKEYFPWTGVDAAYDISGSVFLWEKRYSGAAEYRIGKVKEDGMRFLTLEFPMEAKKYCVSPYDFAIYTGNKYWPEMPVHGFVPPDRPWPPAYEWGMFKRSSGGRFNAVGKENPNFVKNESINLITSNECIINFRANTNITEEIKP
jgi:hypothetical protein